LEFKNQDVTSRQPISSGRRRRPSYHSLVLAAALALVADVAFAHYPHDLNQPLARIGIGSCNVQDEPQPHWSILSRHKVDLWLWLGDNIDADTEDMTLMKHK
jgi:hypothetical protein